MDAGRGPVEDYGDVGAEDAQIQLAQGDIPSFCPVTVDERPRRRRIDVLRDRRLRVGQRGVRARRPR